MPSYAFGNGSGWLNLQPDPNPPSRGFRIISGRVFWTVIWQEWRVYLANSSSASLNSSPPQLGRLGATGVYFTDRESLRGVSSAVDYARRVGMSNQARNECSMFGCAVIEFAIQNPMAVTLPPPFTNTVQGLTVGGAREWFLSGNPAIDNTMRVTYIDWGLNGPRYFSLPL